MAIQELTQVYDLRSALAASEARGELVRIQGEVETGRELPNIVRNFALQPKRPVLLFDKLRGFPGWRAATAVLADEARVADLYGFPHRPLEFKQHISDLLDHPLPPVNVASGPCQENVITQNIDLASMIPWTHGALKVTHRYWQGAVISKDLNSGKQNVGIYRACVQGPDTVTVNGRWDRHFGHQLSEAKRQGVKFPVAYVLGFDPIMFPGGAAKLPYGADDFGFLGAVRRRPVEMVKCVSQDLYVPADAEVVIEGEICPPYQMGEEGPWPEYLGYLGMNIHPPVMRVTAITHRNNPITYITIPAGAGENHGIFTSAVVLRHLRSFASTFVIDCTTGPGARFHHLIVKVRKSEAHHEGLQLNVALSAFGVLIETDKVTLVDDDIDIYDPTRVAWAEATRCNPGQQVHILCEARTQQIVPIAGVKEMFDRPITKAKMIVDATIPWEYRIAEKGPGITFFTQSEWNALDLTRYVTPEAAERWVKRKAEGLLRS